MQIKVVRHHRRPKDADRYVEHCRILDYVGRRRESPHHADEGRLGKNDLEEKADTDGRNERDHQRLEQPKSLVLQVKNDQHVQRRDDDAVRDRYVEDEVERDGRPDYFRQITGRDRYLAGDPQQKASWFRVVVATRLRQIAARDDAKLGSEPLEQNRHQVRRENYTEQGVAELGSAGEVGCPVSRVHVTDRDQVPRSGECEDLSPPTVSRHGYGAINLDQRGRRSGSSPSRLPSVNSGCVGLGSFELNRQRSPEIIVKLGNKLVQTNFLRNCNSRLDSLVFTREERPLAFTLTTIGSRAP